MSPLFAVLLFAAAAKEPYPVRVFDPSGLDAATIKAMADRGTFLVVDENDKGKPELVTAGVIIDATPETVYGVITDYAHFTEFMPQLEECKIVKERADGTREEFESALTDALRRSGAPDGQAYQDGVIVVGISISTPRPR